VKTFIIAEAGVNHGGDLDTALHLVDAAAAAGADAVKFQTFKADRLVTRTAAKADYQTRATGKSESQHEMLRRLELDADMHRALIARCGDRGIQFLSTGFDLESVDLLAALGQEVFKIPSGEITNLPYLRHIGKLGKTVLLSTGMATLAEVKSAVDVLVASGTNRDRITVLQCTTDYPAPIAEVNLRAMQTMRDALGVAVGYSDHTLGIDVSLAAVAMGAVVIEKHFTLDRNAEGPDHKASLEPADLAAMVAGIRNVEQALGDGIKKPGASETKNLVVVRKSIVASRDIREGDVFDGSNVTVKRPGNGLSPMRWDDVIGQRAKRAFAADELIEL
jgi:N,N'-diacetyllegionaminate synthase